MKSLIEFFHIGPKDNLSKMLKQLRFGYPGGSYGMDRASVVASFQNRLSPVFGGDSAPVLKCLTKPDKW